MNERYGQNGRQHPAPGGGVPGHGQAPGYGQAPGHGQAPGYGAGYGAGPVPPAAEAPPAQGGGSLAGPLLQELRPPYRQRSAQVVAVQMYGNGGHSVLWPNRPRQDHNRPMLRPPYAVYEVALGWHVSRFALRLPALGDAEFFEAEAGVHWRVEDPVRVVEEQVRNVAGLLHDELQDRLRYVSRQFRLTEAQHADEAVQAELGTAGAELGAHLGLRTKVYVRIDLSERVVEQVREGEGLDRQLDIAEREHRLRRRREQQQSELVRERARAFEDLLARGDAGRIAYFMAKDPDKALQIEQHFANERRKDEADRVGFLTRLIDAGLIERHDIRDGMYEALQYLQKSGRTLGRTVGGALPAAGESGPEPGSGGAGRRRPFWEADEGADSAPELEAGGGGAADGDGADGAWDEGPSVHEPSSVESAEERERWTRDGGGHAAPPRRGRASDRFDDWGD